METLNLEAMSDEMIRDMLEDADMLPPDVVKRMKQKLGIEKEDVVQGISPDILAVIGQLVSAMKESGMTEDDMIEEICVLYDLTAQQAQRAIAAEYARRKGR